MTSKNIGQGNLKLDKVDFISQESFEKLFSAKSKATRRPQAGDILIGIIGTFGNAYIYKNTDFFGFSSSIGLLRPNKDKVTSEYLYYVISSPKFKHLHASSDGGSVQGYTNIPTIKKIPIPIPPLEIQKNISSILGVIDDRITLLRETNTTLEAIAQALFKSWFVDFDPVHAKQQGRAPEGMDAQTAALFPDAFEESELGMVPKGWEVKALDQIADYLNGLALQKFPPTGVDDLPVIKIAQLRKGDSVGADKASRSIKPEYIIKDGDVLFSWSGSLEVEVWCGGEGALNQHLFKVTSKDYPKWLYLLATKFFLNEFRQIAASKATTMGHIQRKHLSDAKLAIPKKDLLEKASSVFEPILERYIANSLQAKDLAELRDTLLPRLISGQLRLPEAQALSQEAMDS